MNQLMQILLRFLPCAFDPTNMNRIHAGTVTVWAYKSDETVATIVASGFFDVFTEHLRQGDQILISGDLDGTPARDSAMVSSADNASTVTVVVKV
jgi:hypothetical protein